MDVHTPQTRSFNMSRILSKNTTPEIKFRKILSSNVVRGYRLHYKLTGKPDVVFPKKKIAVFVDGCFWHKCRKHYVQPKTKKKFWLTKIEKNIARDKSVNSILKKNGWFVLRIWEHEIEQNPELCSKKIKSLISV